MSWSGHRTQGAKLLLQVLLTAAVIGTAIFVLKYQGAFTRLEWIAGDALKTWDSERQFPLPDLKFIVLDQRSLQAGSAEFGLSWPWPRETYARVLNFLRRAPASAVILDFIFTEPSFYGPADDQLLAQAVKKQKNVFLAVVAKKTGSPLEPAALRATAALWWPPQPAGAVLPQITGFDRPVPGLLAAVAGVGDVRFTSDADGILRRVQPLLAAGGKVLPALGIAAAVSPAARSQVRISGGWLQLGQHRLPLDKSGQLELRFPAPWKYYDTPKISLIDVITSEVAIGEGRAPKLKPEIFANAVVIIGSTAEALQDLRSTPIEAKVPGCYISGAVWAAAAHGRVYDPAPAEKWSWLILAALVILGAWWGTRSFGTSVAGIAATLLAYLGLVAWFFASRHAVLELAGPAAGLGLAWSMSLGLTYRREQAQKNFIQAAFHQMLSPQVVEGLIRDPARLLAGGELQEISVYFSDLQGFTQLSEKLDAKALVRVLNVYLEEMIAGIVEEYDGYVDKFIGDAVMAFWGAPLPEPEHAYKACLAALRNQERLEALQARLKSEGLTEPLRMRIGIHTGPAVVGMMGSPRKLNYTVIGDTVNLASRLEGANKLFGTRILISGDTRRLLGDRLVVRELDRVRVQGKSDPTQLFELFGHPDNLSKEQWLAHAAFAEGVRQYYQREFAGALTHFRHALRALPLDSASRVMAGRCEYFLATPPSPDWDGVTTLEK